MRLLSRVALALLLAAPVLAGGPRPQVQEPGSTRPSALAEELRAPVLPGDPRSGLGPETLLVRGGKIRVGDGQGTLAEALLVEDGRVVAFGSEAELRARLAGRPTRELDLAGAVAVPALQDAHVRLEELGATLAGLDLSACASLDAVLSRSTQAAAAAEPGAWIVGRGFDPARLGLAGWPAERALDPLFPDHPMVLLAPDRQVAWVNRRALEAGQIPPTLEPARARPAAPDGVARDAGGVATGVLRGEALRQVLALVPPPTREQRLARILLAQEHLLARGIGGVHDQGTRPDALELYRELLADGRLRLRVVCYLDAREGLEGVRQAIAALGSAGGDRLRAVGIALDLDRSLSTRGAALLEPYSDQAGESGRTALDEGRLLELVTGAARAGLQPALRATGDRAARLALDVYRQVGLIEPGLARLRPRIEDGLLVSTRDWPRFPELGVALVASPRCGTAADLAALRVGPERWRRALGWLRLAPHVGPMALGSLAPERASAPLGVLAALRFGPGGGGEPAEGLEELPDGRLALAGLTSAAAWAAREDHRRGRLVPGYLADLTVLSLDPVEASAEELAAARVLAVVVGGEVSSLAADAGH